MITFTPEDDEEDPQDMPHRRERRRCLGAGEAPTLTRHYQSGVRNLNSRRLEIDVSRSHSRCTGAVHSNGIPNGLGVYLLSVLLLYMVSCQLTFSLSFYLLCSFSALAARGRLLHTIPRCLAAAIGFVLPNSNGNAPRGSEGRCACCTSSITQDSRPFLFHIVKPSNYHPHPRTPPPSSILHPPRPPSPHTRTKRRLNRIPHPRIRNLHRNRRRRLRHRIRRRRRPRPHILRNHPQVRHASPMDLRH